MSLIKSISGIRGTIGGSPGDNLTPIDIVECVSAFGTWVKSSFEKPSIVVGRDGRISGEMLSQLSIQTLVSLGINVINLDYTTTPTLEMMVTEYNAQAGIIFTASHNPMEWNALKFINHKGEFISKEDGQNILSLIGSDDIQFSSVQNLGKVTTKADSIDVHIQHILDLPYVNQAKISAENFHVAVDCINSTGSLAIPKLLDALGCTYELINAEMKGKFAHNPEPLPQHITQILNVVKASNAMMGIIVDPDVDRLALVDEEGTFFGEEYTLVAVADHVLTKKPGNTVSNLSSTRALADVTHGLGGKYTPSAVGEVNVVNAMKASNAVIGGEGNGGVILPDLHYGRDALVGIAMVLSMLAERKTTLSQLKKSYPVYHISKNKIQLTPNVELPKIIAYLQEKYSNEKLNTVDGLKIDFEDGWVHLRASNTEPILRVYSEAKSESLSIKLAQKIMDDVKSIC